MSFEFTVPTRIVFGGGSVNRVPGLIGDNVNRILLVTGKNPDRSEQLCRELTERSIEVVRFVAEKEPDINMINRGTELARTTLCEMVIAMGGGSVIDCGKAISALIPNPGDITDYLEVIGLGKEIKKNPLPFMAIPTTAGTGAEVTKNAVIHSPENHVKVSLRSPLMFPAFAIIDPELTISMPPEITAISGMDALSHLLETFVCNQPSPITDAICRDGLQRISSSLRTAYVDGNNREARTNMALASMLGGMALANVKLGAVHGFAAPLGGMFPIPHGAACAALLPAVTEINIREVKRQKQAVSISRYKELGQILTGNANAEAEDGVKWLQNMVKLLNIPSLTTYGLNQSAFPMLVEKAKNASSMKGNPISLDEINLVEILERSL